MKISKAIAHRITTCCDDLVVDGYETCICVDYIVRVSAFKGAIRVEEDCGQVTYIYRGVRITRECYGMDRLGNAPSAHWATSSRRTPHCDTLADAMAQRDRCFYGPVQK